MAKPKLALIPSTQGTSLYSVLPANGVGDFAFTRGSSATRINSQGLIETVASGVSRLNYPLIDGVVNGCPSHLLEPSRTNNFVQSNQFNTSWNLNNGLTLTGNQLSTLSGVLNAWKLESDGSSGFLSLSQVVSVSGTNTFSIYAKAGTNRYISLRSLSGVDVRAQFDLQNGEVYGSNNVVSANIEHIKDGWYRCDVTLNASNNAFYIYPNIQGVATAGNIYIQYSQLEGGSFPTSIIPTTTSSVTRSAETANGAGDASTFNDSEGVLFSEISALADGNTYRFISLSDGTSSNRVSLFLSNTNTLNGSANGVSSIASVVDIKNNNKVAYKYKSGDYSLWANGFEVGTLTVTTGNHSNLNRLNFDYGQGSDDFYGNTKQIQYFDSALNDSELETLTSWTSFRDMANGQLYTIE